MIDTLDTLAAALVAAHDGGPLVDKVPEHLIPADMDEVYALQDRIIGHIGGVGGWKIAAGAEGEPLCAPIPANRYFPDGATLDATKHRFIIAEVEVAVRLRSDVEADADAEAVAAAIEGVLPVLELVGNPFAHRDATERRLQLGDLQSNGAVIVGPDMNDAIRADLASLPVGLSYDGVTAKENQSGASWEAIIAALMWLAPHAAKRGPQHRG